MSGVCWTALLLVYLTGDEAFAVIRGILEHAKDEGEIYVFTKRSSFVDVVNAALNKTRRILPTLFHTMQSLDTLLLEDICVKTLGRGFTAASPQLAVVGAKNREEVVKVYNTLIGDPKEAAEISRTCFLLRLPNPLSQRHALGTGALIFEDGSALNGQSEEEVSSPEGFDVESCVRGWVRSVCPVLSFLEIKKIYDSMTDGFSLNHLKARLTNLTSSSSGYAFIVRSNDGDICGLFDPLGDGTGFLFNEKEYWPVACLPKSGELHSFSGSMLLLGHSTLTLDSDMRWGRYVPDTDVFGPDCPVLITTPDFEVSRLRRQLMLFTALVVKCEFKAPGQGWETRILTRAGCPAKWQAYIIDLARKLECKWNHEGRPGMNDDVESAVDVFVAQELSDSTSTAASSHPGLVQDKSGDENGSADDDTLSLAALDMCYPIRGSGEAQLGRGLFSLSSVKLEAPATSGRSRYPYMRLAMSSQESPDAPMEDVPVQEVSVDSADVIRLIIQFLKENNLNRSMQTLQEESQIYLDAVESIDGFCDDITHGRWDKVIQTLATVQLPKDLLQDIYEQAFLECLGAGEKQLCSLLLKHSAPLQSMKGDNLKNLTYRRLESLLSKPYIPVESELFQGEERPESRRNKLSERARPFVREADGQRLLTLLNQALKYQQNANLLPPGEKIDIFRGTTAPKSRNTEVQDYVVPEEPPTHVSKTLKFGKGAHPESVTFSPSGQFLVTGAADGLIEVWNHRTGKRNKEDLPYQAKKEFMCHPDGSKVLSLAFSHDSNMLASGDEKGTARVWDIHTGQITREFKSVHSDGITCMEFSRDNQKILTGSLDYTCRLHGMHSGRTLKDFRGHKSYVNSVGFADGSGHQRLVVSGCADGFVRVFDLRSSEILHKFSPPPPSYQNENITLDVRGIVVVPGKTKEDTLLICQQSSTVHHMSVSGQVLKSYESGKRGNKGDFLALCTSHGGRWIYAAAEDRTMWQTYIVSGCHLQPVTDKLSTSLEMKTLNLRVRMEFDGRLGPQDDVEKVVDWLIATELMMDEPDCAVVEVPVELKTIPGGDLFLYSHLTNGGKDLLSVVDTDSPVSYFVWKTWYESATKVGGCGKFPLGCYECKAPCDPKTKETYVATFLGGIKFTVFRHTDSNIKLGSTDVGNLDFGVIIGQDPPPSKSPPFNLLGLGRQKGVTFAASLLDQLTRKSPKLADRDIFAIYVNQRQSASEVYNGKLLLGRGDSSRYKQLRYVKFTQADKYTVPLVAMRVGKQQSRAGSRQEILIDSGSNAFFIPSASFDSILRDISTEVGQKLTYDSGAGTWTIPCVYRTAMPTLIFNMGPRGEVPLTVRGTSYVRPRGGGQVCDVELVKMETPFWILPAQAFIGYYFEFQLKEGRVGIGEGVS
ncbi:Serine/threonine-protein kinase smu1 [Perkinsus chesapeaki]|uniref:Serine/threonine-protein kinase smu1 n=1 Tax=Perkinsus chesapeaki TaxID=330153 RepID=A0A7J6MZ61_PERCH|nr:Serine/threonine-protein kinase smu1 [Perkinsus chesapeaki]